MRGYFEFLPSTPRYCLLNTAAFTIDIMLNHYRRGQSFYRARYLRMHTTYVERLMWIQLRNRRFHEYKFRRQVSIGNYIADFLSAKLKLIIELSK